MADFDMSKVGKAEPRIKITEIQVRDYDPELIETMRAVVDDTLKECGTYTLDLTGSGHVELVDGDIDTADIAKGIVEKMHDLGWMFVKSLPWTIVTEEGSSNG